MKAFVIDTIRTPRGRGHPTKGALSKTAPWQLLSQLFTALTERGLDPSMVDDVLIGCVTQTGPQGGNIAKTALMMADWPDTVSAATINRYCASGLDACNLAACKVKSGMADVVIAGGVESISQAPMFSDHGPWYADKPVRDKTGYLHMGVAADLLATIEGFERHELDAIAARSHQRAQMAWENDSFVNSVVPIEHVLERDELIRPGTTAASLAELPPAFASLARDRGVAADRYPEHAPISALHHVGNSPALADGAALLVFASKEGCRKLGVSPTIQATACADASVDPVVMLTGAVPAAERALRMAGMKPDDIDLFEINEAFAAGLLHFERSMNRTSDEVNVFGGAIAMGHALGATGAMLVGTLIDAINNRNKQVGLVAAAGGAGVASAMILERCT